MADLTLYEYRDMPEDELEKIFQKETRKMFGVRTLEDDLMGQDANYNHNSKSYNEKTNLTIRYWGNFLTFISSPFHKFQKHFMS